MWSISIYSGDSPFNLTPIQDQPVLTRNHVTDIPAAFVADPFMIRRDNTWYMFFEVMNSETRKGEIALATSDDGLSWTYRQSVLNEPFHLSYPHVFEWQNDYYMIPETLHAGSLCLYKADNFPFRWTCIAKFFGGLFADPSIFRLNNMWWMFSCSQPYRHDTLNLSFARELTGPWAHHQKSPIINRDSCRARPAGRVLMFDNKIIRFAQDCARRYGNSVRAFEVSELTFSTYSEVEHDRSPILTASGSGWNSSGMHHIDAHKLSHGEWLACVDGTE